MHLSRSTLERRSSHECRSKAAPVLRSFLGGIRVLGWGGAMLLALTAGMSAMAAVAHAQTVTLTKEFLSDPLPGETVVVRYTANSLVGNFVTNFAFTDDLDAALAGLQVIGTPAGTACGTLTGSSTLSVAGGFISPNGSCSFDATLLVPVAATSGTYPSPTSNVTGNEIGVGAFSDPGATDELVVIPIIEFTKSFLDDPVAPGGTVILEFAMTNNSSLETATALTFTDNLDAALSGLVATGLPLTGTCGIGMVSGTDELTFQDGRLSPGESCAFQVALDVPVGAPTGSATNTTSSISGMLGMAAFASDGATDDLRVGLPVLTKEFTDDPVFPGDPVNLQFTITNLSTTDTFTAINFTDDLSATLAGLEASTLPADGFCGPGSSVTGTTMLSMTGASLAPSSSCTFSVGLDVPTSALAGSYTNTTTSLFVTLGVTVFEGEPASDNLAVSGVPTLTKTFTDDPVAPGEQVTLEFTITNFNRLDSATNIAFTDDLDAALTGLVAVGLPLAAPCGAGSSLSGTSLLTLAGGDLGAQASCTFSVTLDVPMSAAAGDYTNVTSAVTSDVGGVAVTSGVAMDDLVVEPATLITLDWSDDPVVSNSTATLDITLVNSSPTGAAADVTFDLDFATILPTFVETAAGTCDGDVMLNPLINPVGTDVTPARLVYGFVTPGTLAAGASCTIRVVVNVAPDASATIYPHTSSGVTSTVDAVTYIGPPGSDDLAVVAGPSLTMEFTDDPAAPGDTVNLEFTLTHEAQATTDATGITFTHDLNAGLAGLTASLPPTPDPPCGAGSTLTGSAGDTLLTLMGGTLAPGETCVFGVTLNVPAGATANEYPIPTSGVGATVAGLATTSLPASDELRVTGLRFSKEFLDDPVIPGGTTTLRFTIENTSPNATDDATGIFFTDSLSAVISGLAATGTPLSDPCGIGSSLSGTTFLIFEGGSVAIGESCTIDVEVSVPAGAADGSYLNQTSGLTAMVNGSAGSIDPATDRLEINSNLLQLTKSFTDDPVAPDSPVTLEFTLSNLDATEAASAIAFSDDLAVTVAGLTFDSVLLDSCGGTVIGMGTTNISVSDVMLAAGATCTLRASLTVPALTPASIYTNTTSGISGTIGGLNVVGSPATDTLEVIQLLDFSKSFDGPTTATGSAILTFTITNPGSDTASGIAFSDDLDAVIPGLVATSLPAVPCGAGSTISGTSFLTITGGELPPNGGMCSFDVDVQVPLSAASGVFPNVTSDLTSFGLVVSDPATADLTIEPPPAFSKAFSPDTIFVGAVSTLTFTIDNSASVLAATGLAFVDNLPAGMAVATPSNASNACGGTLTASDGTGVITLAGGNLGAGATCIVSVDVTASVSGAHVNVTGDLASSSGLSGTATDTLMVNPTADLSITKTDGVTSAVPGASVTYTIVAANAGPSTDPAAALSDTFPAALTCTYTSVAAGGATGNTAAGAGDLAETLSLPAGGSVTYTATCSIDSDATGTLSNTATITASVTDLAPGNNSATDSDTVLVPEADLGVTKSDGVTSATPGASVVYTIVVANSGPSDDPVVSLIDTLPASLTCTSTSVAAGGATGNTAAGAGDLAETLSMPAGSSVTYTVDCAIDPAATGTLSNTATVSGSAIDNNASNDSATDNDTVLVPDADLAITKTDGVTTAVPGESVIYTIVASNNGPSIDVAASLMDVLPATLTCTYTSVAAAGASGNTAAGSGALMESLSLPVGGSVTYTVDCTIDPTATGALSNTATIAASGADSTPGNNSATDGDTVLAPEADLGISKDGPTEVTVGNSISYTLEVANNGPSAAANTMLVDPTPMGLSFSSASAPCAGGFPCNLGTVEPGTPVVITAVFDVPGDYSGPDPIENIASVSSDALDSVSENDSSMASTDVVFDAEAPVVTDVSTSAGALEPCQAVRAPIGSITVRIEDEVSPVEGADSLANYLLVGTGPDGDFSTMTCGATQGDDVAIAFSGVSLVGAGSSIVEAELDLATSPLDAGLYRFLVCDTIADAAGNALDGDDDNTPGGDFEISVFRADPLNLFENGHFDDCPVTLAPWAITETPPNTVSPGISGTDDVVASPLSASAHVLHSDVGVTGLSQCVAISSGPAALEAAVRFDPAGGALANFVMACEVFDGAGCAGSSLAQFMTSSLLEDEGGAWVSVAADFIVPAGSASAVCDFAVEAVGSDLDFSFFLDSLFLGAGGATLFEDGFESGDTSAWTSTSP